MQVNLILFKEFVNFSMVFCIRNMIQYVSCVGKGHIFDTIAVFTFMNTRTRIGLHETGCYARKCIDTVIRLE